MRTCVLSAMVSRQSRGEFQNGVSNKGGEAIDRTTWKANSALAKTIWPMSLSSFRRSSGAILPYVPATFGPPPFALHQRGCVLLLISLPVGITLSRQCPEKPDRGKPQMGAPKFFERMEEEVGNVRDYVSS
jgi:hypothetical protein